MTALFHLLCHNPYSFPPVEIPTYYTTHKTHNSLLPAKKDGNHFVADYHFLAPHPGDASRGTGAGGRGTGAGGRGTGAGGRGREQGSLTSGKRSLANTLSRALFPHWLSPTATIFHRTSIPTPARCPRAAGRASEPPTGQRSVLCPGPSSSSRRAGGGALSLGTDSLSVLISIVTIGTVTTEWKYCLLKKKKITCGLHVAVFL